MANNQKLFLPHGGYRKLRSYKVAEVVYDVTVIFCRRFLRNNVRMTDQMVQAAHLTRPTTPTNINQKPTSIQQIITQNLERGSLT
ncbi:MAG: hypothetical protein ACOCQP_00485 [Lentisphaeria bacterium]